MKLIIGLLALFSLVACAHSPEIPSVQGPVYKFETVTLPSPRAVSTAKNNKTPKEQEKFITVYKCENEAHCKPSDDNKKLIPYNLFAGQLKEKAARKGMGNVVDTQQNKLVQSLKQLKTDLAQLSQENSYYKYQVDTYGHDSLKPLVDSFKKAHKMTRSEIKIHQTKIAKLEKDLNYLNGVKGLTLGMDTDTQKLMELVESGQLKFGQHNQDHVVWNFLQEVAIELAKN